MDIERFQQPEHTGENRCLPCTVVNVVIAAISSALAGAYWLPAGIGVFIASLGVIALRGYLVPGTPTFTERYFPESVLRLFDKGDPLSQSANFPRSERTNTTGHPDALLSSAGVVEPCSTEDDLCLVPGFREAWHERIAAIRAAQTGETGSLEALGWEGSTELPEHTASFVATVDGTNIGHWKSRAAFVADLAAARELSSRDERWDELPADVRKETLSGLRTFLEHCPVCEGEITSAHKTMPSCCRSPEVIAVFCADCDSRFFETPVEDSPSHTREIPLN